MTFSSRTLATHDIDHAPIVNLNSGSDPACATHGIDGEILMSAIPDPKHYFPIMHFFCGHLRLTSSRLM